MRRVRVDAWQVGLVFKHAALKAVIKEGVYWFWRKEKVQLYDMMKPFLSGVELNILLQNKELAEALTVVGVEDNGIVLHFENGLLTQVLTAGRYAFWNSV